VDRLEISYRFRFGDGRVVEFPLQIEPHTMELIDAPPAQPPTWCALAFHQCPNCPLTPADHPHCPAALKLVPVVERCAGLNAYSEARVEVTTPERSTVAVRPLQKGLSSLVGLIMATSGCPRTACLKPMARFHQPLASDDETLYRAASMYMLAQYFVHKHDTPVDLELTGLGEIYQQLQSVNTAMGQRLRAAVGTAAATHAIVSLDLLSHILPFDIKASLAKLRPLFAAYRPT
jgi:uncharacterized protein YejL (UPF0352 family)